MPGCAIAAGLLTVSLPIHAEPTAAKTSIKAPLATAKADTLRLGETASFFLPEGGKVHIDSGDDKVLCVTDSGNLSIKALGLGAVKVRIEAPGQDPKVLSFQITPKKPRLAQSNVEDRYVMRRDSAQLVARTQNPPTGAPSPLPDFLRDLPTPTTATPVPPGVPTPVPPVAPTAAPPVTEPATTPVPATVDSTTLPPLVPVAPLAPSDTLPPTDLPPTTTVPSTPPPAVNPPDTPPPAINPPVSGALTPRVAPPVQPPVPTTTVGGAQVGPNLPPPNKGAGVPVTYATKRGIPRSVPNNASKASVQVSEGLARLLTFRTNILSVFFSDPKVMDARAINARTIAVTGIGSGESTLAVFTADSPNDVIGTPHIYRIQTTPRLVKPSAQDPEEIRAAIENALGDPRIRVTASRVPDGTIAVRLTGAVRNEAEVQGAVNTARLYVPQPVSALYADPNAPTLDQAIVPPVTPVSATETLQSNLRRLTGNDTIELVPMPAGLGLKAEVNSAEEAEQLWRVLPTLNTPVQPFIVIHGAAPTESPYYNSTMPLLQGENLAMTQNLQMVTGVRTVYAIRTAGNAVAIYGTVRTKAEYESVKRYAQILPQISAPIPVQGSNQGGATVRPTGSEAGLPNNNPTGGFQKQLGVQLFVRITDASEATIRNVTVETNIVEITHQALRNLGVQYGSASTTSETSTGGAITRVINPAFVQGTAQFGNGFAGLGGRTAVDPFRARVDALVSNGDARILSNPNVSAVEGGTAQITIGGERPVPAAVASIGSTGQSVEFRRFGVIITMRPTVTDDNNIILQIRADVTQPDSTYEINLNGAIIPGETVRSVDTTLTVRPGDVVVMGGLINNEKRQQTSKVPVLGDLPVIGSLFRSRRFENNETELAIFMTPRIDFLPASAGSWESVQGVTGFPPLPGRQESNTIFEGNRQQAQ